MWWGTSGERKWTRNELGPVVLHTIRERGLAIWGEDILEDVPPIAREDMVRELADSVEPMRKHARPDGTAHSVEWLLNASRQLLWLREARLSSKSEAADWGFQNATGAWRIHLPRAKHIRRNPESAQCPDVRRWLESLEAPNLEAIAELESELVKASSRASEGAR